MLKTCPPGGPRDATSLSAAVQDRLWTTPESDLGSPGEATRADDVWNVKRVCRKGTEQRADHVGRKCGPPLGRPPPLGVQRGSNRRAIAPLLMQHGHPPPQCFNVTQLLKARYGTDHRGLTLMASYPVHHDFHAFALALQRDDNPLDQVSNDGLPLGDGGAGRVPQRGDILRQPPDGLALWRRECRGLLPQRPAMLRLERFLGG